MVLNATQNQPEPMDRKLGNEWANWDGDLCQTPTQTPAWVFWVLIGCVTASVMAIGLAGLWLIAPRVEGVLEGMSGILAKMWVGYWVLWYGLFIATASGVKGLRRWLRVTGGVRSMLGGAVLFGRLVGLSRDQVGHSYLLVHNQLEIEPRISDPKKLLLLIPRCLAKEILVGLKNLKEKYGFTQTVAVGGNEARQAIAASRPQAILAIACERDLISGIQDLHGKIPVVALTNERPEGPCKNTMVDLKVIEKIVVRILGLPTLSVSEQTENFKGGMVE